MKFVISSIHRLTLLDYPGHIACIAFLPGCNLRCHYCHNSEFVLPEKLEKIKNRLISEETFFQFLKKRQGKLEGVVISGGEPTIHAELPEFCRKIKNIGADSNPPSPLPDGTRGQAYQGGTPGYKIKLDTNGTNPEMLKKLLDENLLDYVAMDVKSMTNDQLRMTNRNGEITVDRATNFFGVRVDLSNIEKSRDLLFSSGIDYELRTTLVRQFHDTEEFQKLCDFVKGSKKWVLQNFRASGKCLNPEWEQYSGFTESELQDLQQKAGEYVERCEVRG